MTCDELISYIEQRTAPYTLNEIGRAGISELYRKYPEELLIDCIDTGVQSYFIYDKDQNLTSESVARFLKNLPGIAYNRVRPPIDKEIYHLKNLCRKNFNYWSDSKATSIFQNYVTALKSANYSDAEIIEDLKNDVTNMIYNCSSWSQWRRNMVEWTEELLTTNSTTIEQQGSILPESLFLDLKSNVQTICKQINASYENHLFDCTAVMMRRLLEALLVLSYQNLGIEDDITNSNGQHLSLDKIIKNASENNKLALSSNAKRDMSLFKDLGNYSAHRIWYNATEGDIKPHMLKYRVIIEELLYKSGMKI